MDGFLMRPRFIRSASCSEYLDVQEPFGRSVAAVPSGPPAAGVGELYLAHAEAGFRSGYLDVYQWTFVSEAAP